jgi:hypothetical protein
MNHRLSLTTGWRPTLATLARLNRSVDDPRKNQGDDTSHLVDRLG